MASRALSLKMKVVAADPFSRRARGGSKSRKVELDALLARADFHYAAHAADGSNAQHPLGQSRQMQAGVRIVSARGGLIDEAALESCRWTAAMWRARRWTCSVEPRSPLVARRTIYTRI
ncbi:MAG: hypothetical protein H6914_00970 [Novosphingobium sp.]|nr:hypothetical protein [Novosphingobium sp.]